jgi:hypothetical protein
MLKLKTLLFALVVYFPLCAQLTSTYTSARIWFDGVENNQLKVVTEVYTLCGQSPTDLLQLKVESENSTEEYALKFELKQDSLWFCNKPPKGIFDCGENHAISFRRFNAITLVDLKDLECELRFSIQGCCFPEFSNKFVFSQTQSFYVESYANVCEGKDLLKMDYQTPIYYPVTEGFERKFHPEVYDTNLIISTKFITPKYEKAEMYSLKYPNGLGYGKKIGNSIEKKSLFDEELFENKIIILSYQNHSNPTNTLWSYENIFRKENKIIARVGTISYWQTGSHSGIQKPLLGINAPNPLLTGENLILDYRAKSPYNIDIVTFSQNRNDSTGVQVISNIPNQTIEIEKNKKWNRGSVMFNVDSTLISPTPYLVTIRAYVRNLHYVYESGNLDSIASTYRNLLVYITDTSKPELLHIKNAKLDRKDVYIYPNPTDNLFTFNAQENIISYKLTNIEGKVIKEVHQLYTKSSSIDLSQQLAGIYFIILTDVNGFKTIKKIIKN